MNTVHGSGKKIFKPFDFILIFCVLLVVGVSLFFAGFGKSSGAHVIVATPEGEWIYDLETDSDLEFEGIMGTSYITVEDGKAFFVQSPCANQLCVHSYPAQRNNDIIACLPNQIFLMIEREDTPKSNPTNDTDVTGF
ncbi:MAG: NusG domain II-containing protein [Spirochaetales bacterium]